MNDAFICDATRTPTGRYGGVLKDVYANNLGAAPVRALIRRNSGIGRQARKFRTTCIGIDQGIALVIERL